LAEFFAGAFHFGCLLSIVLLIPRSVFLADLWLFLPSLPFFLAFCSGSQRGSIFPPVALSIQWRRQQQEGWHWGFRRHGNRRRNGDGDV
jgi:hypothetical protein